MKTPTLADGISILTLAADVISGRLSNPVDISRRLVNFSRIGDEPRMCFSVDDMIQEALHVMRDDGLLRGVELPVAAFDARRAAANDFDDDE